MNISEEDAKILWHPFRISQKEQRLPSIERCEGLYLYDDQGNAWMDAIASWWVNLHGHCHPHIAQAISGQAHTLDQVIFANFTHPKAVELPKRLLKHLPENQVRAFYTDDGSTAVEVALKMALQYWYNIDQPRTQILTLEGAYHGDTFGSMSVSGRSAFSEPFKDLLFEVIALPFPSDDAAFETTLKALDEALNAQGVAAFIFEPLLQGVAGMRTYDARYLDALIARCKAFDVPSIADEVFTGFGRTGNFFACDALENAPDIFCLSKGITGGTLPLGLTTCTQRIYESFSDPDSRKRLYHGHSYTANGISCAAACASLDLLEQPQTWERIRAICEAQTQFAKRLKAHPALKDARNCGTILALELSVPENAGGYFNQVRDDAIDFFMQRGIFLRPIGNILYIVPPYCTTDKELSTLHQALSDFIEVYASKHR